MTARQAIIVDIETTSLDVETCAILEVAAINMDTGETWRFVPYVESQDLANAQPVSLSVNRYYERRLFGEELGGADTRDAYRKLAGMLGGNSLGGSNPRFDAAVLKRVIGEVWHHRLPDLSSYAAGVLGLPITELPGLSEVCELLGIVNHEPHSALGDVTATAACFKMLAAISKERNE